MAKKKVNVDLRSAAEVESGDVNITYNDVLIAGLSETVEATLRTGGTVVEHDIVVDYTKPEPATVNMRELSIVNNSAHRISILYPTIDSNNMIWGVANIEASATDIISTSTTDDTFRTILIMRATVQDNISQIFNISNATIKFEADVTGGVGYCVLDVENNASTITFTDI